MQLHDKGKEDYIKELKKQRDQEIQEGMSQDNTELKKFHMLLHSIKRFNKRIKDTDTSLFLHRV